MSVNLGGPAPDTSDMVAVHNVFRESFSAVPNWLEASKGDLAQSQLVIDYLSNVLSLLRVHHEGEDELLTPILLQRCPSLEGRIREVAAGHDDVHSLIDDVESSINESSEAGNVARVVASIGALSGVLNAHLEREENEILPLCADHLSMQEWGALPEHAMRSFQGDKVWLVFGLVLEQMSDAQRAVVLAHVPPPALEAWTSEGERSFNELIGTLRAIS